MDTKSNAVSKKTAATSRISYAFGAFGHDISMQPCQHISSPLLPHLFNTGDAAQNNRMVYTSLRLLQVCVLSNWFNPFIGNMIDNTKTRWGKFKPWVVAGGTISSIALLILFTDMGGLNKTNPVLYDYLCIYLHTMDIFYSFKDIGFGQWFLLCHLVQKNVKKQQPLLVSDQLLVLTLSVLSSCRLYFSSH